MTLLRTLISACGLSVLTLSVAMAQTPPAAAPATPAKETPPAAAAQPAPAPAAPATPPAAATPAPAADPAAKPPIDGWAGEVAGKGSSGIALDEAQTKAVQTVSDYFAALDNLKGSFVQIGADKKRMKGKFSLKRPGRFRFDYSLPSRQVIISDGKNLAIQDLDLNNEDRVALDDTPFRLLLRKDVNLLRDAKITEVQQGDDTIVLGLQDKSPDTPGKIKLYMVTKPEAELKEWVTTDAQGLETRVEVSDLVKTEDLDAKLFVIQQLGAHRTTPN
jgi:outer membrane lipoprotein-sorting protein